MTEALLSFHRVWGWVAIGANAAAGLLLLVVWRVRPLQKQRWIWWPTIGAEAAMLLQVLIGTIIVASNTAYAKVNGVRFHMFYGFVAFITVGLAYQYRGYMKSRRAMIYGLVGLFLMGVGIRAWMQVAM
jgi:heme A synthase